MQQEELSLLRRIICVGKKMPLEFGNDRFPPCESIAWVWHERDDPIGHRLIAVVGVVDVHLPYYQLGSLVHRHGNHSTYSVIIMECAVVSNKVVSARKNARSAHVEISTMERLWMRERNKETKGSAQAQVERSCHESVYLYIHKHVPRLFRLLSFVLRPLTFFCGPARLYSTLVLYGTYRSHDQRMKSAGVEGA